MRSFALLPLTLLGPGCASFDEDTGTPSEVAWEGYVYKDLYAFPEGEALAGGHVEVLDLDGERIAQATELEDYPGYFQVVVPPKKDVAIRIGGPGHVDMVWRGVTPSGSANWLSGALFSRHQEALEDFVSQLGLPGGDPGPLADGEVAWMWGEPWADQRELWAGADIVVYDGEGVPHTAWAFTTLDDGSLVQAEDQPVDIFLVFDIAPGEVTLRVDAPGQPRVEETWPAEGGELLSAVFFTLPSP